MLAEAGTGTGRRRLRKGEPGPSSPPFPVSSPKSSSVPCLSLVISKFKNSLLRTRTGLGLISSQGRDPAVFALSSQIWQRSRTVQTTCDVS